MTTKKTYIVLYIIAIAVVVAIVVYIKKYFIDENNIAMFYDDITTFETGIDMPAVKNSYPNLPIVKYLPTSLASSKCADYIKSTNYSTPIKAAAMVMFINETGWGKSGINNNYAGIQADSGKWKTALEKNFTATVIKVENRTGKARRFIAFSNWRNSIDFLLERVQSRGLYIGGYANLISKMNVKDNNDFAIAYYREWVTGQANYNPTASELSSIKSLYSRAINLVS